MSRVIKYHPNIKLDYFREINTIEKAYWLGLLYADGWITKASPNLKRIGLAMNIKDEILINRFITTLGLNPKYKNYKKKKKLVQIRFASNKIANDLEKWGIFQRKSRKIQFPILKNRDLKLSFLLGYFDGDGKQKTTCLSSGSLLFLKQIKRIFNINNKIRKELTTGCLDGISFTGEKFDLYLGAKLFNEMLDVNKNSLQRKRHRFMTEGERIAKIKQNIWSSNKVKFLIKKEQLRKLVWELPLYKIGLKHNVSGNTVKKWCNKYQINTPPRGFWVKKSGD